MADRHHRPQFERGQIALDGLGVRWAMVALAAAVIGWAASAVLTFSGGYGLERFMRSYLVSFAFFLSLGLGGLFFVLVTHLTRAGWSVALRRIAEALSLTVIPLAVMAIVIFVWRDHLYIWTDVQLVEQDPLLTAKARYLDPFWFGVRLAAYFVIWTLIAVHFFRRSAAQDGSADPSITIRLEKMAAPAVILFALTLTFASFDLLMSLDPHWYSTIFGVYYFAGSTLGAFCTVTVLVFLFQRAGRLSGVVSVEHYHDLGKLTFAFVVFWAYIAFSQFMLIWYAHIPEETAWYLLRQEAPWGTISLGLLAGHFLVPFLWLVSRHPKRRPAVLFTAALWLLAIHWFDMYWLVMPEKGQERVPFHALDVTTLLAVGGLCLATVLLVLDRGHVVAIGDPRLAESMELENV